MNGLETRELRCFVAVAEELHFGRAAARLHLAQPAVSRTVAGLERRLGVRLLDRSTRHVALTDAGTVLLREATTALAAVEAAERLTLRAARPASFVVAAKPDGDAGLLPAIERRSAEDPDALPLEPLLVGAAELTDAVRSGRADAAIVAAPFDGTGLDAHEILREPRVAALPAAHPLAAAASGPAAAEPGPATAAPGLTLRDIDPAEVARWDGVAPALAAFYAGCDPESDGLRGEPGGPVVRDLAEALRLIELGRAIAFLPRSVTERYGGRAIAYRTVAGLSPQRLSVVWRQRASSPALAAFLRAAVT
jgi:DNA-binding transcriptional LysR family regulator